MLDTTRQLAGVSRSPRPPLGLQAVYFIKARSRVCGTISVAEALLAVRNIICVIVDSIFYFIE
jgi:hypothetical protein